MTGWETLCDWQQMTGYTVDGGYAEYVLADPLRRASAGEHRLLRSSRPSCARV